MSEFIDNNEVRNQNLLLNSNGVVLPQNPFKKQTHWLFYVLFLENKIIIYNYCI